MSAHIAGAALSIWFMTSITAGHMLIMFSVIDLHREYCCQVDLYRSRSIFWMVNVMMMMPKFSHDTQLAQYTVRSVARRAIIMIMLTLMYTQCWFELAHTRVFHRDKQLLSRGYWPSVSIKSNSATKPHQRLRQGQCPLAGSLSPWTRRWPSLSYMWRRHKWGRVEGPRSSWCLRVF